MWSHLKHRGIIDEYMRGVSQEYEVSQSRVRAGQSKVRAEQSDGGMSQRAIRWWNRE